VPFKTGFRVVGYFERSGTGALNGEETAVAFDSLTQVNYAFMYPTSAGDVTGLQSAAQIETLAKLAHPKGVRVLLSIGGWMNGNDSAFESLAANASARAAFVNKVAQWVTDFGIDGADIDWEFPDPGASSSNYATLMSALASKLHGMGKILTSAVHATAPYGDGIPSAVFSTVDFLTLMAYDHSPPPHSSYNYAVSSLDYWLGRGLLASKAVLGVPFYGREPPTPYKTLVAQDPQAPYKDQVGSIYYNGLATMRSKTQLAASRGSGVMIWTVNMDTHDATSLLGAIHGAAP